jgi:NAD(P)-dependent dehydrogenase (short-subunit alcohol dehydrogenase family)
MYKGFDLSGKVAVLTGSTAGMGFAIARGFLLQSLLLIQRGNTST